MDVSEESGGDNAGTNRRDLIKGAAGVAAAATVGGMLMSPQLASAAPRSAAVAPQQVVLPDRGLYGQIQLSTGQIGFKVFSAVWSGSNSTTIVAGTTGPRIGASSLAPLIITRNSDANSNALIRAMIEGTSLVEAKISLRNNGQTVQSWTLNQLFISSMGMSTAEEPVFEELELVYTEIRFTWGDNPPATFGWNVAQAKIV
jgi:type VI protein secretion system component Hcp